MEYIRNLNKYDQDNQKHWVWGVAEGGASVFFVSAHSLSYVLNIYGYS